MVHQEIVLVNEYTVWENIVLGAEPVDWLGRIDRKRARQQVQAIIDRFHFALDPGAQVAEISVAARQKVEILKLLYRNVSVLILDEPTAVLTPQEIPQLFAELRELRAEGHMIIFISHRLEEVLALSDRVTVLRKGASSPPCRPPGRRAARWPSSWSVGRFSSPRGVRPSRRARWSSRLTGCAMRTAAAGCD